MSISAQTHEKRTQTREPVLNGVEFIRLQMHVADDKRPTGWIENYDPGIRREQALEFAELQIARFNRQNPSAWRRLLGVRVFVKSRFGPWIRPEKLL